MPLFGGKHKTPQELVKAVREGLALLSSADAKDEKKSQKALEEVSRSLASMKTILCGEQDTQVESVAQLSQAMYADGILLQLVESLGKIDFESRKDAVLIFNNLLRRQIGTRLPTVEYVCQHREILTALMTGYRNQELALNCGVMLRECFRYEDLARLIMYSDDFYLFFEYVEVPTFDISSDAFSTFKELLTRNRTMSAEFLVANYDKFFQHYHNLLNSENYVTRRQALKLLSELLLEHHYVIIMTRYIGQPENLKLMMNMLRESSRNIQFEAFHVFKVFVANPDKPRAIQEILLRNRDRLVEFLTKFHTDRSEDEQFNDEKAYLIKLIKEMKPLEDLPVSAAPAAAAAVPPAATTAPESSTLKADN